MLLFSRLFFFTSVRQEAGSLTCLVWPADTEVELDMICIHPSLLLHGEHCLWVFTILACLKENISFEFTFPFCVAYIFVISWSILVSFIVNLVNLQLYFVYGNLSNMFVVFIGWYISISTPQLNNWNLCFTLLIFEGSVSMKETINLSLVQGFICLHSCVQVQQWGQNRDVAQICHVSDGTYACKLRNIV